jgi:hypothetical protein
MVRGREGEKEMTEKIFPEELIKKSEELSNECKEDSHKIWQRVEDIMTKNRVNRNVINSVLTEMCIRDSVINKRLEAVFFSVSFIMEFVNIMGSEIGKNMANKKEVTKIRTELTKKVTKTLIPIANEIEKAKEREKKIQEGDMYK